MASSNMISPKILIPAVLLLLGIAFWAGTLRAPRTAPADAAAGSQETQNERGEGGSSGLPPRARADAIGQMEGGRRAEPNAAEIQLRQEQAMRKHESDFMGEALDARWATATEAQIAAALSAPNLAELGAEPPASKEATCRSKTCRIEVVFADEEQAELTAHALFGQIATSLPNASSFRLPQPDGTQRMLIYATNPPPRRRPSQTPPHG